MYVIEEKSAYPTSQDPHYLQTIRNLTLDMCSNKNNPIFSLINHSILLSIADQSNKEINNFEARSAMEYMLQVNEWLKNISHPYCLTKKEFKDKKP